MPIGSSKIGVLGAGLVPGGSVTFNASGTWDVPPGVKKVSITGKGGTGNPGVAGNAGNPGNPGTGGGGGSGGASFLICPCGVELGGKGGWAYKLFLPPGCVTYRNNPVAPTITLCNTTYFTRGGNQSPVSINTINQPNTFQNSLSGGSGNAGQAGQTGQAGNSGQPSSALGNTFPGGAGGNAPPGGTAGNGGTGGCGGGRGNPATSGLGTGAGTGGSGGTGGGSGGGGGNKTIPQPVGIVTGGKGGGGAGSVNSGENGPSGTIVAPPFPAPRSTLSYNFYPIGGTGNVTGPLPGLYNCPVIAGQYSGSSTSTLGGNGGKGFNPCGPGNQRFGGSANTFATFTCGSPFSQTALLSPACQPQLFNRTSINAFSPTPERPDLFRSGGGGGGGKGFEINNTNARVSTGGGGGGGGRGNAGNAGGNSPTVSGSAANPQTFNCVPVTPGTPTPITVGSPGGQVVISWNPQ